MGKPKSPETRAKMRAYALARPESHNRKISEALRGRQTSPESIEAQRKTKLRTGAWKPIGHTYIRRLHGKDYRFVKITHGRGRDNYKVEHRLVLEKVLERELLPYEHVHHLNGDTLDNRPENLVLISKTDHTFMTKLLRCTDERLAEIIIKTLMERFPHLG